MRAHRLPERDTPRPIRNNSHHVTLPPSCLHSFQIRWHWNTWFRNSLTHTQTSHSPNTSLSLSLCHHLQQVMLLNRFLLLLLLLLLHVYLTFSSLGAPVCECKHPWIISGTGEDQSTAVIIAWASSSVLSRSYFWSCFERWQLWRGVFTERWIKSCWYNMETLILKQ